MVGYSVTKLITFKPFNYYEIFRMYDTHCIMYTLTVLYLACKLCFFKDSIVFFKVFFRNTSQNYFLLDRWQWNLISWVGRRLCWRNARIWMKNKIFLWMKNKIFLSVQETLEFGWKTKFFFGWKTKKILSVQGTLDFGWKTKFFFALKER